MSTHSPASSPTRLPVTRTATPPSPVRPQRSPMPRRHSLLLRDSSPLPKPSVVPGPLPTRPERTQSSLPHPVKLPVTSPDSSMPLTSLPRRRELLPRHTSKLTRSTKPPYWTRLLHKLESMTPYAQPEVALHSVPTQPHPPLPPVQSSQPRPNTPRNYSGENGFTANSVPVSPVEISPTGGPRARLPASPLQVPPQPPALSHKSTAAPPLRSEEQSHTTTPSAASPPRRMMAARDGLLPSS